MSTPVKYVVLLGDGMSDRPLPELGGRTPLMAARTPHMDSIARKGTLGTVRTIPEGMALGSDVANLSILGYDPAQVYTGRSPIEAAGMGVDLGPGDIAFRCNLVTLARNVDGRLDTDLSGQLDRDLVMVDFAGGHPGQEESGAILQSLSRKLGGKGIEFHQGVSYRHLMVWRDGLEDLQAAPPHDLTDRPLAQGWPRGDAAEKVLGIMKASLPVLADHPVNRARSAAGRKPVNAIWLWGQGRKPRMAPFRELYGLTGAMITAVDLLKGLGASIGFRILDVPGATGYLDTNYEGKASAALEALRTVDLVYLHVEAPDEAGHGGSLRDKVRALEDFDARVVSRVMNGLQDLGPHRVLLTPDHATPLQIKTHAADPVPFAVYDSRVAKGSGRPYDEDSAAAAGLFIEAGHQLMGRFVRGEI